MTGESKNIITQLQKDILRLQGFKSMTANTALQFGLGPVEAAFPTGCFPLGAIHEFLSTGIETAAATSGFIAGLLSILMRNDGSCVWISSSRTIFPPALKSFGIEPDHIIFVDLEKEKDVLWVMEEALKCNGLAAVVGEIKEISFTASRRLQLAVEQSRVTGFVFRNNPRNIATIASIARWKIMPIPSETADDLPGIGFPRWNVQLLKVRNGKSGTWEIEWSADRFRFIFPYLIDFSAEEKRKTG